MIKQRRYKALIDFPNVHKFLTKTYDADTFNGYLTPQFFEFDHVHRLCNYHKTHRFGIWEDDGIIVGFACYSWSRGECLFRAAKGYEELFSKQLEWCEKELLFEEEGNQKLTIRITKTEKHKRDLLEKAGYIICEESSVMIYDYKKGFAKRDLPKGFMLADGIDVDYVKLNNCFWRGFENIEPPSGSLEFRIHLCNAPNFRHDLMTVIKAPDGEYACALFMWLDEHNKYAYLEPLATAPKYQRMGLAAIALTAAMQKTKDLGASYCIGADEEFYRAIGFEKICTRESWSKEL